MVMSVASATRVFAAGTTAEDTLCRCVTGKDSSVAFIESSANPGTVSPASRGAPTCYGGLSTSYPSCQDGRPKLRKPLICRYLPSPVISQELAPFQGG